MTSPQCARGALQTKSLCPLSPPPKPSTGRRSPTALTPSCGPKSTTNCGRFVTDPKPACAGSSMNSPLRAFLIRSGWNARARPGKSLRNYNYSVRVADDGVQGCPSKIRVRRNSGEPAVFHAAPQAPKPAYIQTHGKRRQFQPGRAPIHDLSGMCRRAGHPQAGDPHISSKPIVNPLRRGGVIRPRLELRLQPAFPARATRNRFTLVNRGGSQSTSFTPPTAGDGPQHPLDFRERGHGHAIDTS